VIGVALGLVGVNLLVRIFPAFPASPPTWAVGAALGISIGVGVIFGFLPARRAAKLDPVVALSHR
jgi:putative ABC transport system permease protein